jgi:hypothetical protein
MKKVMIGVPMYDATMSCHTHLTLLHSALHSQGFNIEWKYHSTSALPFCFNKLLAWASNPEVDYFVMMHSDLGTSTKDWLPKMIEILHKHDLAVLSAVSPIKTSEGLTSTAVDGHPAPRRLTLKELHGLPEKTFTNEDCKAHFGKRLLINTGLMIWDMAKMRDQIPNMPFEFHDGWRYVGGGMVPKFIPEDWLMSRRLDEFDIPYGATLEIPIIHSGRCDYSSETAWGEDIDPQYLRFTNGNNGN